MAVKNSPHQLYDDPSSHACIRTTLHETTTKAPKQCSECQETSNGRPTLLSGVLRERHLAVNESAHQHDHAMRRLDRPRNPTTIPPTATTQPKQGDCKTHTRRKNCAIRLAPPHQRRSISQCQSMKVPYDDSTDQRKKKKSSNIDNLRHTHANEAVPRHAPPINASHQHESATRYLNRPRNPRNTCETMTTQPKQCLVPPRSAHTKTAVPSDMLHQRTASVVQ